MATNELYTGIGDRPQEQHACIYHISLLMFLNRNRWRLIAASAMLVSFSVEEPLLRNASALFSQFLISSFYCKQRLLL
jgi:hypothetical protein